MTPLPTRPSVDRDLRRPYVPGTMCAARLFDVGLDYQAVVRRLMYEIDLAPEQAIRAATAARSR